MKYVVDIAGEICDSYCKYPSMCKTERELDEKYCDSCPLNNL